MVNKKQRQELGVGLIGIGRLWGYKQSTVPSEEQALEYLSKAHSLGIRFFDTAPAYGSSEIRLGKFVRTLKKSQRKDIIISTKFGEHWDTVKNIAYTDHSYAALVQSLHQSLDRLGTIDMLLLHKTTPDVLQSSDLQRAIVYAKTLGIPTFGASVSDLASAEIVCNSDLYTVIQFPYNEANFAFDKIITLANTHSKTIIINRPFNMGRSLYADMPLDPFEQKVTAYTFILNKQFNGFVLTGTKSPEHLQENLEAFQQAQKKIIE
jgi:aryl-alcohol dehydrogenase-like predicted oxidoreductase